MFDVLVVSLSLVALGPVAMPVNVIRSVPVRAHPSQHLSAAWPLLDTESTVHSTALSTESAIVHRILSTAVHHSAAAA